MLSGGCEIRGFDVAEVLNTTVKVDELQKRLFAINSFEEILSAVRVAREMVEKD